MRFPSFSGYRDGSRPYRMLPMSGLWKSLALVPILLGSLATAAESPLTPADLFADPGLKALDACTLLSPKSFIDEIPARSVGGNVHVVVEIPAGTTQKWEVDNARPAILACDRERGQPRIVRYLGYPGNYGMIPGTLGGDGDPLDVLVLGNLALRGSVIEARPIGVLEFVDRGERDDKILAVPVDGSPENRHFSEIRNLEELKERFPGAVSIVRQWFLSYKGMGAMELRGEGDAERARALIERAVGAYARADPQLLESSRFREKLRVSAGFRL